MLVPSLAANAARSFCSPASGRIRNRYAIRFCSISPPNLPGSCSSRYDSTAPTIPPVAYLWINPAAVSTFPPSVTRCSRSTPSRSGNSLSGNIASTWLEKRGLFFCISARTTSRASVGDSSFNRVSNKSPCTRPQLVELSASAQRRKTGTIAGLATSVHLADSSVLCACWLNCSNTSAASRSTCASCAEFSLPVA